MTVTTTQTSVTWAGNGSTIEFTYPFLIPSAGQYALYSTNAPGLRCWCGQSLYSVSGIGNQGGTVVYPLTGSPIAAGTTLTFQRVVPYQQVFHPPAQGPIYNPLLEGALDNLQMQIIQVEQQLGDTMINGVTVDNLTFDGAVSVAFTGSELPGVGETTATITLPPGPQGPIGLTPNISVAANALPVGQSATATLSGTSLDPTITFGLPTGATGQRGSIWYDGAGAPGTIAGALAGDQYLDTNTGNVYQYASGAWTKTTDIMGPQGAQGVQGAQGIPGIGSSILVANNGAAFGTAATELNFTGLTITENGGTVTIPLALSPQLDAAFGGTQGAILYRGASAWQELGPGTAGQVLQSGGAAANPSWVTNSGGGGTGSGAIQIVSQQTVTDVSTIQFTGLAAGFDYFIVGDLFLTVSLHMHSFTRNSDMGPNAAWDTTSGHYSWTGEWISSSNKSIIMLL